MKGKILVFLLVWTAFAVSCLLGYAMGAAVTVEITVEWEICALIIAVTAIMSFLFLNRLRRWEKKWEEKATM